MNGRVVGVVDTNHQVPERSGSGTYRNTESHSTDGCENTAKITGAVPMRLHGKQEGFREEETASGQKKRVALFSLQLDAEAEGLTYSYGGKGLEFHARPPRCEAVTPKNDRSGTAKVLCNFTEAALLEGGSFFSDFDSKDDGSDPGHGESRTCRLDIKLLAAPPPAPR